MKELVITVPTSPIVLGSTTQFVVKAMGTNGLPFTNFVDPTIIQINGDTAAKNDDTLIIGTSAAGGASEKTFNIKFSKPGKFTLYARGGTYTSNTITVTVVGVTATATASLSGTQLIATITNG